MNLIYAAHVITAILFLGPVMFATSTFQVQALAAHKGDAQAVGSAALMYRVTTIYGALSGLVPVFGIAAWIFAYPHLMKNGLYHASILLCIIAWAVLYLAIIPRQRTMMAGLGALDPDQPGNKKVKKVSDWNKTKSQLSMFGGIFNGLWLLVALLMVIV
ncbi:hypothetical protein [Corynebacterium aquilae]|uniref:DUF2269 domain-containing protein n=1 Tax=Corynebacterium aquilae DSM 44791 TaxID=1431546 RepID=A0A1L7CFB8_9CORY|nr:hypothetical protein [Corynebacterium aquilae]APT84524.1 hypothetical protein CAQU_05035 [Corynebacterium aquilae DSM 44791]